MYFFKQISKELEDTKLSQNNLLRDLHNLESTKEKLWENMCIENEKLKKRIKEQNLDLAWKDGKIAQRDEELKTKNEVRKEIFF